MHLLHMEVRMLRAQDAAQGGANFARDRDVGSDAQERRNVYSRRRTGALELRALGGNG